MELIWVHLQPWKKLSLNDVYFFCKVVHNSHIHVEAESDGPSKKRKDNSASVGAQKLATLQPELLALLQAEEKTIQQRGVLI